MSIEPNEEVVSFQEYCAFTGDFVPILDRVSNDRSIWEKVKVRVSSEFIDELTEVVKYQYRYRLYLSKVFELIGMDCYKCYNANGYYWEEDENGNPTDSKLPY